MVKQRIYKDLSIACADMSLLTITNTLNRILKSLSADEIQNASIEIDTDGERLTVSYFRLENDTELEQRMEKKSTFEKRILANELKEYRRLKLKFEP